MSLKEKLLSRLWQSMRDHDTGTITASRSTYTKNENRKRNYSLRAKLNHLRYDVTPVKGHSIENFNSPDAIEVGEKVFFVSDKDDKGKLRNDLIKLGEEFEQDSILFIPKGGESAILVGTGSCPKAYPGKGKTVEYNKRQWGEKGEFFITVRNRPFMFVKAGVGDFFRPEGFFGRWGCATIAQTKWEDLDVDQERN